MQSVCWYNTIARGFGYVGIVLSLSVLPVLGFAQCDARFPETTPSSAFVQYDNGTALHRTTGLIWARCSLGQIWQTQHCTGTASQHTYWEAFAAARAANVAHYLGFNDWHLPTITELSSILEFHCANPTINETVFPDTPASWYWSASVSSEFPNYGQPVDFGNGNDEIFFKIKYEDTPFPVRLVRTARYLDPEVLGLDSDRDGISDALETLQGSNPQIKDNDISITSQFVAQSYRDVYQREVTSAELEHQLLALHRTPRSTWLSDLATTAEFQRQQLKIAVILPLIIDKQLSNRVWLDVWRHQLRQGRSVTDLVDIFMRESLLQDSYQHDTDNVYAQKLNKQLTGNALEPATHAALIGQLHTLSRAAWTERWLNAVAQLPAWNAQIKVLLIAALVLDYSLDSETLRIFSLQLEQGQVSVVSLVEQVLQSDSYRRRFMPL